MKLAWTNTVGFAQKPQAHERASARVFLLALISFFLGVAATATWFHLAAKHNMTNPSVEGNSESSAPQATASASGPNSPPPPFVEPSLPTTPAAIAEVKQALPNYASLSLEQGTQILREATLEKFTAATKEMQSEITKAEDELEAAKAGGSAADQQAAAKHLEQVQADETQKLEQIGGNLQTEIAALKQMKSAE